MMNRIALSLAMCCTLSTQVHAEGGLMGSAALSGAGQGLSSASSQMMSIYGAGMLQQQAADEQLRRDEQMMKFQMEQDERRYAREREWQRQEHERIALERQTQRQQQAQARSGMLAAFDQEYTQLNKEHDRLDGDFAELEKFLDMMEQSQSVPAIEVVQKAINNAIRYGKELQSVRMRDADYNRRLCLAGLMSEPEKKCAQYFASK